MAGINAALSVNREDALILDRSQAYIGVLLDDLVTRGVEEPYRLFARRRISGINTADLAVLVIYLNDGDLTDRGSWLIPADHAVR